MIQSGQLFDSIPAARKRFAESSEKDIPALIADNKALKEANRQLQMQLDSMQRLIESYLQDYYGLT